MNPIKTYSLAEIMNSTASKMSQWVKAEDVEALLCTLKQDKERLDWLDSQKTTEAMKKLSYVPRGTLRTAIDQAMKEEQP